MKLLIAAMLAWIVILTHDQLVTRREIDELWDVNKTLTEAIHEDDEKLSLAAERLKKLEDDGK